MVALQDPVAKMNKLLQLVRVNEVGSSVHAVNQLVEFGWVGCRGPYYTNDCLQNIEIVAYV